MGFPAALLLLAASVQAQVYLGSELQTAEMKHEGRVRTYRYMVPGRSREGELFPMVMILRTSRGLEDMRKRTAKRFEGLAQRYRVILVYPEPIDQIWG